MSKNPNEHQARQKTNLAEGRVHNHIKKRNALNVYSLKNKRGQKCLLCIKQILILCFYYKDKKQNNKIVYRLWNGLF